MQQIRPLLKSQNKILIFCAKRRFQRERLFFFEKKDYTKGDRRSGLSVAPFKSGTCIPLTNKPPTAVLAEREGFEPPEPCGSPVFKTGALNHSATSPNGSGNIRSPAGISSVYAQYFLSTSISASRCTSLATQSSIPKPARGKHRNTATRLRTIAAATFLFTRIVFDQKDAGLDRQFR